MGGQLGLDHRLRGLLSLAAQVHDIGLLAVPEEILNRPSRLGNDEFRTIRKHPEMSFRILQPLTFMTEVLPAVRYHHERMNGTGYPHGLAGQEIPLSARILAVADAYDAMTHDRPHRPALAAIEALRELRRCTPAGYDERCVAALEAIMHLARLEEAHAAAEGTHPALSTETSAPAPSVLGAAGL
jgi:HD-GYP domain-containing protein (c-di-GMP phosphodiesterase class II)